MNEIRSEILRLGMRQLFIKLALPGIVGTLILGLYNFVDGIFVGQFIGPEALGGVSLVYSVVLINQAILTLLGMGSMAVLSIAIGREDYDTINKLFGNLILTLGLLSLVFSVLVFCLTDEIIRFLGAKGTVFAYGRDYLKVLSTGFVFAALGPAINMLFRGEGNIQKAMKILSVGVVLNIVLDFVFIYQLKMGVKGAALATVISQVLILCFNLLFIAKGNSVISLKRSKFEISFELLPKIVGIGSSTMILLVMASLQQMLLFKSLSTYDDPTLIPLLGAAYRVLLFAVIPFAGIGQGLQSIVGINLGAGRTDRVKEAYRVFTLNASVMAGSLWILFMVFPDFFLGMMLSDKEIVEAGIPYFRILFSSFLLTGVINNSATFFQALGKGWKASLVFLSRQIVFFIPLLVLLPNLIGIGGVWLSMPVAELLCVVVVVFLQIDEYGKLGNESIRESGGSHIATKEDKSIVLPGILES
ncbi:MAG: MATE family efflux transporter [Proteobacteria bacterium]|nr:MATE family efflux transporter [Pseudomonadota bacterium]